ncbi:MAG: hypothetical protein AAF581_06745 [Planctomycetota bacterium]
MTRERQRGISLLESMAAVVILGTGMVAGIGLFRVQSVAVAQKNAYLGAQQHLRNELEALRARPFAELKSTPSTATEADSDYLISTVVTTLEPGVARVDTSVSWMSSTGQAPQITVTIIRCEEIE